MICDVRHDYVFDVDSFSFVCASFDDSWQIWAVKSFFSTISRLNLSRTHTPRGRAGEKEIDSVPNARYAKRSCSCNWTLDCVFPLLTRNQPSFNLCVNQNWIERADKKKQADIYHFTLQTDSYYHILCSSLLFRVQTNLKANGFSKSYISVSSDKEREIRSIQINSHIWWLNCDFAIFGRNSHQYHQIRERQFDVLDFFSFVRSPLLSNSIIFG